MGIKYKTTLKMGHENRTWTIDKQVILSKKTTLWPDIGSNIISKNWFSHLLQQWIVKGPNQYLTFNEVINDVNQYVIFYNYEIINTF